MRPRPHEPDGDTPSEDAGRWWLQSKATAAVVHYPAARPTAAYLELVVKALDESGYRIVAKPGGGRSLKGPGGLPAWVGESVKRFGDYLVEHLRASGRLDAGPPEPVGPEPGRVVEWSGADGNGGVCVSEDLPGTDWLRWRYRGEARWHAPNGETWED